LASAAAFAASASVMPDFRSYRTRAGTASGSAKARASSMTCVDSASPGSHELVSLFWTLRSLDPRNPIVPMTRRERRSTTHFAQWWVTQPAICRFMKLPWSFPDGVYILA
jgi:hypothetical protein